MCLTFSRIRSLNIKGLKKGRKSTEIIERDHDCNDNENGSGNPTGRLTNSSAIEEGRLSRKDQGLYRGSCLN